MTGTTPGGGTPAYVATRAPAAGALSPYLGRAPTCVELGGRDGNAAADRKLATEVQAVGQGRFLPGAIVRVRSWRASSLVRRRDSTPADRGGAPAVNGGRAASVVVELPRRTGARRLSGSCIGSWQSRARARRRASAYISAKHCSSATIQATGSRSSCRGQP
jgi:hypothetical protein